jgi:hypothetical protein
MKMFNIYKSLGYFSYQFINYFNNYIIRSVESKSNFDIENQLNKNDCQIMDRSYNLNNDNSYGFFVIIDR